MFTHGLAFDSPWWLALLAGLPVLWAWSYRGLSGLGGWRRVAALTLRSLVYTLLVLALAEAQHRRVSDRVTVLYLLDQSLSVPEAQRDAMKSFVNASIRRHRRDDKQDRAGVVVFGRDAEVELPPIDVTYELPRVESAIDRRATDLAGAMSRAMSLFPHDSAKRVVFDGQVQVFGRDAAAGGTAGLYCFELTTVRNASANLFDDLPQGDAHGHFDQAGMSDSAGQGEDLCSGRLLGADRAKPVTAAADDIRNVR